MMLTTRCTCHDHSMGGARPCPVHYVPDPRDAEVAALKAEVVKLMAERDTARVVAVGTDADIAAQTAKNERTIALMRAAIERRDHDLGAHKRALAAGPAALRADSDWVIRRAADVVEAAQEAAMKEGK